MNRFRLAVINPNTDASDTAAMASAIANTLPSAAEVEAYTALRGPQSIESAADEAFAAAEVVKVVQAHPDHDGYLIACFSDPGLDAVRELTTAPVVGIGEAAYTAASMLAKRFAVITTLARGRAEIEDALRRSGVAERCAGVLALGIPVAEQGAEFPATTDAIISLAQRAVDHLGAEAIVLGCGGMSDVEATVATAVGVPATNGVVVGALMLHALCAAGLSTSKQGSYSPPEAIPYQGMPAVRATG
ncbi:MAG: aspartate/glutamate racemase family protein [Solirubrobacteraceae bacterium]